MFCLASSKRRLFDDEQSHVSLVHCSCDLQENTCTCYPTYAPHLLTKCLSFCKKKELPFQSLGISMYFQSFAIPGTWGFPPWRQRSYCRLCLGRGGACGERLATSWTSLGHRDAWTNTFEMFFFFRMDYGWTRIWSHAFFDADILMDIHVKKLLAEWLKFQVELSWILPNFFGGIYKHRKPQREEIEELSEGLGFLMICSFQQVYGIRYTILFFGAKFATTVQINHSWLGGWIKYSRWLRSIITSDLISLGLFCSSQHFAHKNIRTSKHDIKQSNKNRTTRLWSRDSEFGYKEVTS